MILPLLYSGREWWWWGGYVLMSILLQIQVYIMVI